MLAGLCLWSDLCRPCSDVLIRKILQTRVGDVLKHKAGYEKKITNESSRHYLYSCCFNHHVCFHFRLEYFHLQLLTCYFETVATQSGKCVRHLIRLKRNPLSGKQLIWLIIRHYLLTPRSHKILDLNTQPAWDYCTQGFVCLVMAEKYLLFDPPVARCSCVQCDLIFNKG